MRSGRLVCLNRHTTVQRRVWRNGRRSIGGTEASSEEKRTAETRSIGSDAGQADPEGGGKGKLLRPARSDHVRNRVKLSERRAR